MVDAPLPAIAAACPAPVAVRREGGDQFVVRSRRIRHRVLSARVRSCSSNTRRAPS